MPSQTVQQGWNQATAAMQTTMARGVGGRAAGAPRKRRKVKAAKAPKRRASARKAKPARLVKGSAAAKRYMASIRKRR